MAQFDYTNRDFSTIRAELLDRATRALPEWTDRNASDFMMALIDLWSYAADVLHYYVDRAAGEAFLPTATQRESVLAFANLYDYSPSGVASSTLSVTLHNDSLTSSTLLPEGTAFNAVNDGNNYGFYSSSDVTIPANTSVTISLRQGTKYSNQSVTSSAGETFSNGQPSQRFSLFHKNVDPATIIVNVYEGTGATAVEWTQVVNLSAMSAADSVYRVQTSADGTVYLVFGNGINGRIPSPNVSIKASYAVSSGSFGNVPAGSISTISSAIYPDITIVSSTSASGGVDAEPIESIKASIPRAIRTQGNAVTLSDFADLALSVPGVSKAVAQYQPSVGSTGGSVTIHAVSYQSDYLTAASAITLDTLIRERVFSQLINSAMLGVSTIAVPSTVLTTPVYVGMNLYVKDNYVSQYVKNLVESAVNELFNFSKVSFGQVVNIGEFYRKVLAIEGVNYVVITSFNTTAINNTVSAYGEIQIDPYKLPRKGEVSITVFDGVSPPI